MLKLSVIIPVYNAARYLRVCRSSVVKATEQLEKIVGVGERTDSPLVEVICVDDGSTDGSGAILDEYKEKVEKRVGGGRRTGKFVVIHQKNAGAWAARNVALKLARGEWITFVDSDDVLNPHWLEVGLKIALDKQVDLVRLGRVYGRKVPEGFTDSAADASCSVLRGAAASAWMWNTMAEGGFLWRCFIRREIIDGLEFLPTINCKEDSVWLLGLAQKVKSVAEGRFAGYFYRDTDGSLMTRKRKVSQSVAYLAAFADLWAQQKEQAERDGYVDVVRKNIRASADNDVIEWVMKSAKVDDFPRGNVMRAYGELESAGAYKGTKYTNRWRYRPGFAWWRWTGQIWMMRIPGMLFLFLRMMINRLKS